MEDFFSPLDLTPDVSREDALNRLADMVFHLSDSIRKQLPIGVRQAQAGEELGRKFADVLVALEAVAKLGPKIESAEKHMANIDGSFEAWLPAQHLGVGDAAAAAKAAAATAEKAVAAAERTALDTKEFRTDMEKRDVGKLGPTAQLIRVSGEILAKLAALDLLAKGFVLLFLAGLIFGAHYAYPLVHGAAPLICK